jgi:hypothetical protein
MAIERATPSQRGAGINATHMRPPDFCMAGRQRELTENASQPMCDARFLRARILPGSGLGGAG